jgi:hypothetical protein
LRQGLLFHEHDESKSSDKKENFLEFMRFLDDHNKEIYGVILDDAPQNLGCTGYSEIAKSRDT